MNLGGIYQDLGNLNQALVYSLKSVKLNPLYPDADLYLGGIYKALGNFKQALEYTLKSLEFKSDNPNAHMKLGDIYRDLGNLDLALVIGTTDLVSEGVCHLHLDGFGIDLE